MHRKNYIVLYQSFLFLVCVVSLLVSFFIPQSFLYYFVAFFLAGWITVIFDLIFSNEKLEQKIIWTLVLVMLNGLILPFYWFIFLRKGRHSFIFEKLLEQGNVPNGQDTND